MVLPQFANYGSPCFEFFVNATKNHRNLVQESWRFWSDWGFWWLFRIVASLRLKNERGERLSSHRSDHVTGVWERLHNLCNVQRIFPHLGVQHVQLCSQPSHPFIPIIMMHFFSICKLFFSLCTNFLVGI